MTSPPGANPPGTVGVRLSFCRMSLCQNSMSCSPNGSPSDHFIPARSLKVKVMPSPDSSYRSGMLVTMVLWSKSMRRNGSVPAKYQPSRVRSGRRCSTLAVPPYSPMLCPRLACGSTTCGTSGSLSSTGGRLPAETSAASIGASLYVSP